MKDFKKIIIKLCGGYTKKEYERVERKYQALLDSKTDNNCPKITNEYQYRLLTGLVKFARTELYGLPLDVWVNRMYNLLNNNMQRILIRYVNVGSSTIYKLDTTIDNPNQFKDILIKDGDISNIERLNAEELA